MKSVWVESMVQVVKCLSSKHEALCSNTNITKTKQQKVWYGGTDK
jgi:hypothetical protein